MKIRGSYSAMLKYARREGLAGQIKPMSGGANTGSITYGFFPSGGGRSAAPRPTSTPMAPTSAPTGPNVSPEARTALQAAMTQYGPGGGYGKGIEAGLERGRTQAMSGGMQNLVSSGLANTTIAGGLGKKYEQEVAAPTRARMEEGRAAGMSSLQVMLAQMEQGGHQAKLGRGFQASESALGRGFQASESALGRGFAASESGLGRQFQGSQSALNRGFQRDQSALNRYASAPPYQSQRKSPYQSQESITRPYTSIIPSNFSRRYGSIMSNNSTPPSESRIPGSYVGSINGQRWIYDEEGNPVGE